MDILRGYWLLNTYIWELWCRKQEEAFIDSRKLALNEYIDYWTYQLKKICLQVQKFALVVYDLGVGSGNFGLKKSHKKKLAKITNFFELYHVLMHNVLSQCVPKLRIKYYWRALKAFLPLLLTFTTSKLYTNFQWYFFSFFSSSGKPQFDHVVGCHVQALIISLDLFYMLYVFQFYNAKPKI